MTLKIEQAVLRLAETKHAHDLACRILSEAIQREDSYAELVKLDYAVFYALNERKQARKELEELL